ncbi:Hint domain-containing protein [Pseudogemmobacter bohemicus]|uniref:Hint domain-containing protein n=1 Tax=Pseudogemmobacter bohemicus TaxID=2250708 RepID=UPI000DD37386|nr:Hint domain-containing protein [Pseudogemmobacter bohemicus]
MPTTFNWIYLGVPTNTLGATIYIDINETGDTSAENAAALNGQTFGTAGNPLYNNITSTTMNGTGSFLNQNTGQTFLTTYGGTTGTLTHDAIATYNITLTYADGTTATTTGILVQSTTGQLFLAPSLSANAAHIAKPIVSLNIDSVLSSVGSLALDRPMVGWDDGWVQGTDGNDTIGPGTVEPVGRGSDVIDGGDGVTSAGTGWNDDRIDAGGGNDVVYAGLGNDLAYGGGGNESLFGGDGNDTLDGGTGNDTINGGAGNDLLNGGNDADTFLITGANFGTDTIVGGEGGTDLDRIDTSGVSGNITVNYSGVEAGSLSSSTGGTAGFSEIEAITTGGGNDTINAGSNTANSSYVLGAGNDSVIGGSGNEAIDGGIGDDILSGGGGNDNIQGGTGQDLIDGGTGNDTIDGGDGNDVLSGGDDDDRILGGQGNDTIDGGSGADLIYGGDGDDSINGGIGNDTIYAGTGSGETNYIEGGQGDDLLHGSDGTDTLSGGAGADILHGNLGNDSLIGGDGTDSLYGGQGDDILSGGADGDSLDGGDGNDRLTGGSGADTLTGGTGNDVFIIDTGGDLITDFGAGNTGSIDDGDNTNNDFVDLSAYYNETTLAAWNAANPGNTYGNPLAWMRADQADGILQQVGGLQIQNGGVAVAAGQLSADTTGVTCFTRGTMIKTSLGEVAVEDLRVGQHLVLTVDSGYRPFSWIGSRALTAGDLARYPNLLPIRIRAHALGPDNPVQDLVVSPQHRILVNSRLVRNISGEMTALVAAKHLVGLPGIAIAHDMERVEYWHFLFDGHEIVWSNGAQTESLYTGKEALKSLSPEARREIFQIFPNLERPECVSEPIPARRLLTGREGRELTRRNLRKASRLVEVPATSVSAHMV